MRENPKPGRLVLRGLIHMCQPCWISVPSDKWYMTASGHTEASDIALDLECSLTLGVLFVFSENTT